MDMIHVARVFKLLVRLGLIGGDVLQLVDVVLAPLPVHGRELEADGVFFSLCASLDYNQKTTMIQLQ